MENKSKRLVKGSQEAKDHMAALRLKRGNKKPVENTSPPPPPPPPPPPEETSKPKTRKNLNVDFT